MIGSDKSNRRGFMKFLAASPLLAQIAAQQLYAKSAAAVGLASAENVYSRLGVKTVINCRGTWTYLSGSLEFPEVRAAQQEAANHFVNMVELQQAAGRRLAELTGAESGLITSGAAGAMAASAAACMAGADPKRIWQLPDTTGMKHEEIMVGGRSAFDSAIRLTGAQLVLVEAHGVPLLLDDAAGIPPAENLTLYAKMKIDLYTFSGGKGLRGPQCSGVLLGRKDLIDAALRNCNPWEGAVCRPMKVGKEEVIGCLTAVETWLKIDSKKLYAEWNARIDRIAKLVETVPGVTTSVYVPEDGNRYPTLKVSWDENAWGFTITDCVKALRAGDPVIEVLGADNPSLVEAVREGTQRPDKKERPRVNHIELVSMTIQDGEEMIVGRRLREILGAARKGKAA